MVKFIPCFMSKKLKLSTNSLLANHSTVVDKTTVAVLWNNM